MCQPERNPSLLVRVAITMTFYEKTLEGPWWMLCLGRSRGQNPRGLRPRGFWPWDLPRHNIHHGTSSAFSNNVPVYCELKAVNWSFCSKRCAVLICQILSGGRCLVLGLSHVCKVLRELLSWHWNWKWIGRSETVISCKLEGQKLLSAADWLDRPLDCFHWEGRGC